jgi:hypothetical protein
MICKNSIVQMENVTVTKNRYEVAGAAHGLHFENTFTSMYNCIVYDNKSILYANFGTEVVSSPYNPLYHNCLVKGITQQDANGNLDGNLDPLFINPNANDYTLLPFSPCIDKGNAAALFEHPYYDLAGNLREVSKIDLGAYECPIPIATTKILYVKQNPTGDGSGNSWLNAGSLSNVLLQARINSVEEIWVAEGTYYPDRIITKKEDYAITNPRDKGFLVPSGISLYGGFPPDANDVDNAPNASLTRDQARNTRDWQTYPTILDGKDSAYHVLMAVASDTACIDGFTIQRGNANGSGSRDIDGCKITHNYGGGVTVHSSNMKLKNLILKNNFADTIRRGNI